MIIETFQKNPYDVIDYDFDFSAWLASRGGDTISGYTVSAQSGLTVSSVTMNGQSIVRAFIGGGTSGQTYQVSCQITTSGGRAKQAKIQLFVS